MGTSEHRIKRILIVDDNTSIHDDLRQILELDRTFKGKSETLELEKELFDDDMEVKSKNLIASNITYKIDDAYQGEEALRRVEDAEKENDPYTLIFMDVRMPPGMDGIQTINKIWEKYPFIEIIICTAYSDYSWDEIVGKFGATDQLFFLKKPFDSVSVRHAALSLTTKWERDKANRCQISELKTEVAERTKQVTEMLAYLKDLKEKVDSTIITKTDFLIHISNVLQSALNGILGMTDMLLDTELDKEQRDYAELIRTSGKSLNIIVSNVLDYSLLQSGKLEIDKIEFSLRTAVENVIDLISESAYEKGLEIGIRIDANVPETLIGDALYLRQILLNLATNAVNYTEHGMINIRVSVLEEKILDDVDNQNNRNVTLKFEITDTGIGIGHLEKGQIFSLDSQQDLFFFQDKEHKGLGLKICLQLAHLMNAELGMKNADTGGSVFWLNASFIVEEHPKYKYMDPADTIKGINCLIIGDNPTNRKVLSVHISKWGGLTSEAENEHNAIEKMHTALCANPFEICIVDFKTDGLERYRKVAESIKRHKNLHNVHLICITSQARRGDAQKFAEAGYSAYLTKPIKISHLYNCLRMVKGFSEQRCTVAQTGIVTKHFIDECAYDCYRILIVGCDQKRLQFFAAQCNKLQIRCDAALTLEEASAAVSRLSYDLLLLDEEHDKQDLVAFFEKIRYNIDIPIITVSSQPLDSSIRSLFDECIIEPVDTDVLASLLRKYLKGRINVS